MLNYPIYPMPAVVGHEDCKKALMIALVNRKAGGLLIGGRKGTAKSVLARSIQDYLENKKFITITFMHSWNSSKVQNRII